VLTVPWLFLRVNETKAPDQHSRTNAKDGRSTGQIKSLKKFRLLAGVEKADRPLTRFREVAVFLYRRSHVRKQQKSRKRGTTTPKRWRRHRNLGSNRNAGRKHESEDAPVHAPKGGLVTRKTKPSENTSKAFSNPKVKRKARREEKRRHVGPACQLEVRSRCFLRSFSRGEVGSWSS